MLELVVNFFLYVGHLDLEFDLVLVGHGVDNHKGDRGLILELAVPDNVGALVLEAGPALGGVFWVCGDAVDDLEVLARRGDGCGLEGGEAGGDKAVGVAVAEDVDEVGRELEEAGLLVDEEEDGVDAVLEAEGEDGVVEESGGGRGVSCF